MKLPDNKLKIKNIKLKTGILFLFTFLVLGFMFTRARAQEIQRTITLINPTVSISLNPGQKTEGTTAIINESNFPITFNVGVQDYIVVDKQGTPNLVPPGTLNNKYSAASWIAVYPSTFTVKPQERQTIQYYVQVPSTAAPCGHYAAIVYSPATGGAQGTGSTVETQLGTLFYITVNGKCTESATVTKFQAPPFQEYGPVNILTEIRNNGDIHIKPTGTVTLSGLFANGTYKFPGENIFPETARDFQNIVGHTFMIGPYTATLMASYGTNNNLPLTASLTFWVFPWRITIVIILIIVAIILGIMYFRKRNSSKGGKKPSKEVKEEAKPEVKEEPQDSPKADEAK